MKKPKEIREIFKTLFEIYVDNDLEKIKKMRTEKVIRFFYKNEKYLNIEDKKILNSLIRSLVNIKKTIK